MIVALRLIVPSRPFPHIHIDELYNPENEPYANRRRAFVLIGAMEDWKARETWKDGNKIAELFPTDIVDFYPMKKTTKLFSWNWYSHFFILICISTNR